MFRRISDGLPTHSTNTSASDMSWVPAHALTEDTTCMVNVHQRLLKAQTQTHAHVHMVSGGSTVL